MPDHKSTAQNPVPAPTGVTTASPPGTAPDSASAFSSPGTGLVDALKPERGPTVPKTVSGARLFVNDGVVREAATPLTAPTGPVTHEDVSKAYEHAHDLERRFEQQVAAPGLRAREASSPRR